MPNRNQMTTEARFEYLKKQMRRPELTQEKVNEILARAEQVFPPYIKRYIEYFKLYFGLGGEPPMTYREIGTRVQLSVERVRGMVHKIIRISRHPSNWE